MVSKVFSISPTCSGVSISVVSLSFDGLREANVMRCITAFHAIDDWSPTDWMTAVAGEVGEAANLIKKLRRGEDILAEDVGKELADVVIYLDLLAARMHLDLGECVKDKFNKVSDRVGSTVRLD